jgi:hypothetical protein
MIWLLTGVPGSGKSYFAVDMINGKIEQLQKKEKISYEEAQKKIKVLHNVDGLKVGTTIDSFCAERGYDPITVFTNHYHVDNQEFRGWLFVVDECQTFFPKNMRHDDVQRFFQLHRHYGIDVVLLSQDYKLICPSISLLSEYQFRAVSDTANPLPGFFMYRQMVGYEEIGRKFKRKKKKVFDLYKTADFDQKQVSKKSRPMLIIFIICAILGVFGVLKILSYKDSMNRSEPTQEEKTYHMMTLEEKKKIAQNRTNQSNSLNDGYISEPQYPESYLQKLQNLTLLTLDVVEDHTGIYFLLMGTFWPEKEFPYKVIKTRIGLQALVPLDLKKYVENQKILLSSTGLDNPNDILNDDGSYSQKEQLK